MSGHVLVIVSSVLQAIQQAVLVYFILVNTLYGVLLVSAAWTLRRHQLMVRNESSQRVLTSQVAPSISMLAPAYNEAATISDSVRALLTLHYPNLDVVVINDGSRDDTLGVLIQQFNLVPIRTMYWERVPTKTVRSLYRSRMFPNLVVVDKENGGKADALNVGLNVATGDLVCAIDADTIIEQDALLRVVRPFLAGDNVLAAGGTIRLANNSDIAHGRLTTPHVPTKMVPGIQVVEYLRAFLFGRLGWNRLGGNLIISGAFGVFRREAVIAASGYAHDTVGEDMELVLRLRRFGYEQKGPQQIEFVPDPVAWTEAPESLKMLRRQRDRWHRGLADVMWRHRAVMFNPRYRAMGMFVYPYFLFFELLGPVVEAVGLVSLIVGLGVGGVNVSIGILFVALAYGLGLVLSTATLVLEEFSYHRYAGFKDRWLLLLWAVVENLGYRQLTVIWRLQGLLKFVRGNTEWGTMERRGFHVPPGTRKA